MTPADPNAIRCYWSPRYYVPLPAGHVFPMHKFPDSARQLVEARVIPAANVIEPGLIHDRDLFRVHTPQYVRSIRTGEFDDITRKRLGLPWSVELSTRSHCAARGTLRAAVAAMADGIACNLAGGTHHAFADRGEGFCVFNDVAIAIRSLQADEPLLHAMVVDLDAHQGNGTHALFHGDRRVFTYSIHVGRNYPSVKVPGSCDVELDRYADGRTYLRELARTLPAEVERFEPDIAFFIAGVDVHTDDRFGQMRLSTRQIAERDRFAINLLRGWGIPTVVLYGGGYNTAPGMTTRLHCQTVAIAAERFAAERNGSNAPKPPDGSPRPSDVDASDGDTPNNSTRDKGVLADDVPLPAAEIGWR